MQRDGRLGACVVMVNHACGMPLEPQVRKSPCNVPVAGYLQGPLIDLSAAREKPTSKSAGHLRFACPKSWAIICRLSSALKRLVAVAPNGLILASALHKQLRKPATECRAFCGI